MKRPAPRPVHWRRWRDAAPIAVLLASLAAAIALGGWAWRLDRLVYDFGLTLWRRPPPPGIVIVAIDDASIEQIGRWPWSRAVHATLLERLAQARPRAIALDLVLSEPDADRQQDEWLALAMRHAAPVVLPLTWQANGGGTMATLEPHEPLRSAALMGAAEAAVDADGVLRHAFLHAGPAEHPYPHLALALMQAAGEALHPRLPTDDDSVGQSIAGWRRADRLLIRYAGPPGHVERISYADVLRGAVPAARLAGRYVLIGMTAQGLGDTLATPVNERHQAMPGIEVLANTLYTLRSGDTLTAPSEGTVAALSAALVTALMLGFGLAGPRLALPLAIGSVPLALGASLLALRSGLWLSPVPYALPALLAYPLWSWRRLERAVAGLDREIARLALDPLVAGAWPAARRVPIGGDAIEKRLGSLRRAGAMVRQARKFYADSLAAMPTAMLVAGDDARVLLANPVAARLFDVEDAQELLDLDLSRLLGEFHSATALDWPATLAGLAPAAPGIAVEARMGSDRHYVIHAAAVELEGLRRLIVGIADIEPVKQAERAREEVLAFVSHDLRSPASAIVLLADLDLQGRVTTPHDELLREISRLAGRTLQMSEDFVRATEAQTHALTRSPVRLGGLVDDAVADLRAQALAAEVRLQTTVDDGDAIVEVDRWLMARAIGNMLSNAIKHSPRGAAVELEGRLQDRLLTLRVRDHGRGLSPQQMERLARGDEGAPVEDVRGVGLGLLFVQRVARRHGGTLGAGRPASGDGAQFVLSIPA